MIKNPCPSLFCVGFNNNAVPTILCDLSFVIWVLYHIDIKHQHLCFMKLQRKDEIAIILIITCHCVGPNSFHIFNALWGRQTHCQFKIISEQFAILFCTTITMMKVLLFITYNTEECQKVNIVTHKLFHTTTFWRRENCIYLPIKYTCHSIIISADLHYIQTNRILSL